MILNYDKDKLHKLLKDFYNATSIGINLRDIDFSPLDDEMSEFITDFCRILNENETTERYCDHSNHCLYEKCIQSQNMEYGICHAGLVDVAVPLYYNKILLGHVTMGQMKIDEDFSSIYDRIANYPVDLEELKRSYDKIPLFDSEKVESVANLVDILAKHILLENVLKPALDPILEKALAFIDENLDKNISVEIISKHAHISPSTLYRLFSTHFNCSVNEYVSKKKIDKAAEWLCKTNLSIEQIAQKLDFSNTTNFIRAFKRINRITPLQFRKQKSPKFSR